jgi:hypothetical protein
MKKILLELTEGEFIRLKKAKLQEEEKANSSFTWVAYILRVCVANRGIHKFKGGKNEHK